MGQQVTISRSSDDYVTLRVGKLVIEVSGDEPDDTATIEVYSYDRRPITRADWTRGRGNRELEPGEVQTFSVEPADVAVVG